MATINIVQSNTTTGDLVLKFPNGNSATTVVAGRGELITWVIEGNSGVSSIFAINPKPNNPNLFSSGPAKLPGNSINWQGTIDKNLNPSNSFQEAYLIIWIDSSNNSHTYDPLIQVNPGPLA